MSGERKEIIAVIEPHELLGKTLIHYLSVVTGIPREEILITGSYITANKTLQEKGPFKLIITTDTIAGQSMLPAIQRFVELYRDAPGETKPTLIVATANPENEALISATQDNTNIKILQKPYSPDQLNKIITRLFPKD